jgi:hypothetical protein
MVLKLAAECRPPHFGADAVAMLQGPYHNAPSPRYGGAVTLRSNYRHGEAERFLVGAKGLCLHSFTRRPCLHKLSRRALDFLQSLELFATKDGVCLLGPQLAIVY